MVHAAVKQKNTVEEVIISDSLWPVASFSQLSGQFCTFAGIWDLINTSNYCHHLVKPWSMRDWLDIRCCADHNLWGAEIHCVVCIQPKKCCCSFSGLSCPHQILHHSKLPNELLVLNCEATLMGLYHVVLSGRRIQYINMQSDYSDYCAQSMQY